MVGLTPSTNSGALVRWTRRAAGEMHATWLAVHVDLRKALSKEDQTRLAYNLTLARERLVQLYDAWGKKAEADKWRKELEDRQAKPGN